MKIERKHELEDGLQPFPDEGKGMGEPSVYIATNHGGKYWEHETPPALKKCLQRAHPEELWQWALGGREPMTPL